MPISFEILTQLSVRSAKYFPLQFCHYYNVDFQHSERARSRQVSCQWRVQGAGRRARQGAPGSRGEPSRFSTRFGTNVHSVTNECRFIPRAPVLVNPPASPMPRAVARLRLSHRRFRRYCQRAWRGRCQTPSMTLEIMAVCIGSNRVCNKTGNLSEGDSIASNVEDI